MVQIRRQRHTIKGVEHEVVRLWPDSREASLPPIILLHEGLGSVAMWKDFPEKLAKRTGTEIIVYSRAGYGQSDPAKLPREVRYMHEEGLTVLPELIQSLEISNPVLLGHSDGGSIALICAGGTDVELSGLVVMAPHLFVEQITVDSIAKAREVWASTNLNQRLGKYHDDVESAFVGWNDIWLDPDFLDWNIEEYLPSIEVPILAIQGEDDEYGSMAQIDVIARVVAQSELLKLPRCGHSPHRDQPDAVLEAVHNFMHQKVIA